jgi:ABC-type glycerol-3-phosphate transport system substrate-binding protein
MKRTCIALLLAALGCVGCCGTGGKLWNASEKPAEPKVEAKAAEPTQTEWRTWWFEDQPMHLTPERVEGGIY